jgi:hypothetical protein
MELAQTSGSIPRGLTGFQFSPTPLRAQVCNLLLNFACEQLRKYRVQVIKPEPAEVIRRRATPSKTRTGFLCLGFSSMVSVSARSGNGPCVIIGAFTSPCSPLLNCLPFTSSLPPPYGRGSEKGAAALIKSSPPGLTRRPERARGCFGWNEYGTP